MQPYFKIMTTTSLVLALGACTSPGPSETPSVGLANPASTYCVQRGGKVEIQKDKEGNAYGMCHLPDGTVVEEWALFRRDHQGQQ